jgi:hypothetical protein
LGKKKGKKKKQKKIKKMERVLFEGYLSKQSPHVLKGWQRRHFTLTSDSRLTFVTGFMAKKPLF